MRKLKAYAGALNLVLGAILARLMKWLAFARLHPNMNRITRNMWIGGANNPRLVISGGFHAVLDLRINDDTKYRKYLEKNGIDYMNVKIPDGYGASPKVLSRIVEWLTSKVRKGEKVLVHCNLGRGRAALAIAAYIVSEGATPDDAMKTLKERRRVTFFNAQQREALQQFSSIASLDARKTERRD